MLISHDLVIRAALRRSDTGAPHASPDVGVPPWRDPDAGVAQASQRSDASRTLRTSVAVRPAVRTPRREARARHTSQ